MSEWVKKDVACSRDGEYFAFYPGFYKPDEARTGVPNLIATAKDWLIKEGFVKPPYDFSGILFELRKPLFDIVKPPSD